MSIQPFNSQIEQNAFSSPRSSKLKRGSGGFQDSATDNNKGQELIPFPAVQDSWYTNGLPAMVTPEQQILEGDLIDVFPVDLFAKISENFNLNAPAESGSFFLVDGVVYQNYDAKGKNPGDYLATQMTTNYKDIFKFPGSKVRSEGYWKLLQDFGGIDAGSTASQTVSLSSGQSQTQGRSTSIAIGFTAGIKGSFEPIEVNAQLSTTLTDTFSTSVTLTDSITTSTTVDFQAQAKAQRIGVYQFYRSYGLIESDETKKFLKDKSDSSPGIQFVGSPKTTYYATNHFQKVFVVDPS